MTPPNPHRGEIAVDFGGETVRLRLDFSALVALEQQLERGFLALVRQAAAQDFGITDMAVILREALKAASGIEKTVEEVGAVILRDGISAHLDTCLTLLRGVLDGGGVPGKKTEIPSTGRP